MRSALSSRVLLVLVALTLVGTLAQCRSMDSRQRETVTTAALQKLVPDGRIYPNDLATDRVIQVEGAWLFDREILVEDAYGRFTSLDRGNLDPLWYYTAMPGPVEFDPAVSAISALFISDGTLYEVDRKWGNHLHAHPLRFIPSAAPASSGGTAFVPALASARGNRTLSTINMLTGLEGWGMATRTSITTSPVFYPGTREMVYFATEGGLVFAMQAEDSTGRAPSPSWTIEAHGRIIGGLAVQPDAVFVGSEAGELWALDRITGDTVWVQYAGEPITRTPWPAGDQVYFQNKAGFHALDRVTGSLLWSVPVTGTFVVRRGDEMYLRTDDGVVHALSTADGQILRSVPFPPSARFLTNTMDATMYLVTVDGFVFAIGTRVE